MNATSTKRNGQTWHYRSSGAEVGDLVEVLCYLKSQKDQTPSAPQACTFIHAAYVRVTAIDFIPAVGYLDGERRQLRVAGPVVTRCGSVVIDPNPTLVHLIDE